MEHGKDWENALRVKEGEHTLKFVNVDDSAINETVILDVNSNLEAEYKILCYSDKVSVDTIYVDREVELAENEIKVKNTKYNYIGNNYKEVEKSLQEMGFDNIKVTPIYDIFFGITEQESVSNVTINGSDGFKRGDVFANDAEIIITYHMPYESNPNKNTQHTESAYQEQEKLKEMVTGYSYVYVRNLLREQGYSVEYEHQNTHMDFTQELTYHTDDELNNLGYVITGIKTIDSTNKKIVLYVNTTENIARIAEKENLQNRLEQNLSPSIALSAMEQYGKSQYPYGFSLNKIKGRLAETAIDENTWFMKYTCDITNEYGKKIEMNCEAKIKGPQSNPRVYDFYVY